MLRRLLHQSQTYWPGALAGLVAIALGLAVAELAARLVDGASLIVAIGNIVIDNSPEQVTKWAIDTFGTKDKPLLIAGITVVTLLVGTGAGCSRYVCAQPALPCSRSSPSWGGWQRRTIR